LLATRLTAFVTLLDVILNRVLLTPCVSHGGMVDDLSVQVIDLNVRGCLLYRRRTREISERSERFLSSSLHLLSARKRVSGTKGHAATVFDKGHWTNPLRGSWLTRQV
jgi:hypothetical protein